MKNKLLFSTILVFFLLFPLAGACGEEEEVGEKIVEKELLTPQLITDFNAKLGLRAGNKRGLGYLLTAEGKRGKEFYALDYQQMSRDGHYPLEKEFSSTLALEYHWPGKGKSDWSLSLANETSKEQNRPAALFPQPQQRNAWKDRLSLNWVNKLGKGEERYTLFWNRDKKQRNTDWWPGLLPEADKLVWADYASTVTVWGIESKKSYQEQKGVTWREKGKLSREEVSYKIKDLNTGTTLDQLKNKGLNQASYFWEREEKKRDLTYTLGAGLDYNSNFSVYPHWEAKGKKDGITLSWKDYYSLPNAKKLWDMDSVIYLNYSKKYSLYKSFADLQPERRQELTLELTPVLDKSWKLDLKFYQWRLENYIAYQRESYPTLLFRQYGNYPLVNWKGVDVKLSKKLGSFLTTKINYAYQDVRNAETGNLIPYKPFENIDWQVTYQKEQWQLDVGGEYKGKRYYTDNNATPLKPYHLMFSQLTHDKDGDTEIAVRVDNLLAQTIDDGDTVWYEPIYTFTISKKF